MPIQAFVDDSGGKGQGKYFVLAGLVAHSDHWAQFSDEWQACLDRAPTIKYFKMREAAGFSDQFHRFSDTQRNEKLLSLAGIINRWAKFAIMSAIDLEAHQTWAPWTRKPLNEPYFFPFYTMILGTCFELLDMKQTERFEIIFDEQVISGPRAKAWYPVVRDIVKSRESEAHKIMPVDPTFRSDMDFLPIQACDMVAWINRKSSPPQLPSHIPFELLAEETKDIYTSKYSVFYDLERIKKLRNGGERMLMDSSILEELTQRYKQYFG